MNTEGLKTESEEGQVSEDNAESIAEKQEASTEEQGSTGREDPPEQKEGESSADSVNSGEESQLESTIQKLQKESTANYDKYLRAMAELENFKKRSFKERSELIRYAGEHLARDLLDVVDSLELAVEQGEEQTLTDLLAGVQLILQNLKSVLDNHAIRPESSKGQHFDPAKHEALATSPSAEVEPNTVVEEFKKAYYFKEKLLRPAQVVVSEKVASPTEEIKPEDG